MLDWLGLNSLYQLDYGDHILKSVIATSYAKQKLNVILMMFITIIVRIHINTIICMYFTFNPHIDFFLHCLISVFVVLKSSIIYRFISKFESSFLAATQYFVNNYNPIRYRRWKRMTTISIAFYIITILYFFEVNSRMLILYIFQYLLSYFIIDQIEQEKIVKLIRDFNERPTHMIHGKINIVNDYYEKSREIDQGDGTSEIDFYIVNDPPTKRQASVAIEQSEKIGSRLRRRYLGH